MLSCEIDIQIGSISWRIWGRLLNVAQPHIYYKTKSKSFCRFFFFFFYYFCSSCTELCCQSTIGNTCVLAVTTDHDDIQLEYIWKIQGLCLECAWIRMSCAELRVGILNVEFGLATTCVPDSNSTIHNTFVESSSASQCTTASHIKHTRTIHLRTPVFDTSARRVTLPTIIVFNVHHDF